LLPEYVEVEAPASLLVYSAQFCVKSALVCARVKRARMMI